MLDDIEQSFGSWEARFQRFERESDAATHEAISARRQTARSLIALQATLTTIRTLGLLEGIVQLINRDNVFATPPVVRALHETACVSCYLAEEVGPRLAKRRSNDVQRLLYRIGLGTSVNAGFGHIRPITVTALNAALHRWLARYLPDDYGDDKDTTIDQMIYGPLSDRTHPNWGAMQPGAVLGPGAPPVYQLRPQFDEDSIDQLLSATYFMPLVSGEALDEIVNLAQQHPMMFSSGEPQWQAGDLHPLAAHE